MITAPLIVLGQILGFAFATGLNLYATIVLLGLAARLGFIAGLPPAVQGLDNLIVIITAGVLYVCEFFIDKVPHADTVWDVIHTIIRPVAAALLVGLALGETSWPLQFGGAALAGFVALGSHGAKAGLRLILNTRPKKLLNAFISIFEDVCAVAIAIAVLMYPVVALAVVAGALLITVLFGPRLWRAGVLAMRALAARTRGFFDRADWRDTDALPERLRRVLAPVPLGLGKPRVARAAMCGLKGVGSYKNGWVVLAQEQPVFLYLSLMRPRALAIPAVKDARIRHGIWTDTLEISNGKSSYKLFLLKDGPSAETALAELRAAYS